MRKILLLLLSFVCFYNSNGQILSESFDGATFPPAGWANTAVVGGATDVWVRATITTETNPNGIAPHSGAGMALYDAYNYASGNSADLATPSVNLTTGGPHQVRFWMYRDIRYTSNNDSLEVFISATAQTSASGTKLGRVSRQIADPPVVAAAGWYEYTFTIPGSFNTATNYIIFKATSRFGTEMVIDDVVVEAVPSCLAPTGLTNTGITLTSANHSWSTSAGATGYEWAVTTSATPPASGTATAGTTASSSGLASNTTHYLHVRTNCGGTFSGWATVSFLTGYCLPAPTSVDGTGITNVAFGTINNPSGAETNNYGDYSAQSSTHQQGSSVPLAITFNTITYDYNCNVWIDFNDNLVFEAGELVATGVSGSVSPNTLNLNMSIPGAAPVGSHRLRIGATDDAPAPGPCYTGAYGTFEDYTINIAAGVPCSGAPVGVSVTPSVATFCNATNSTTLTASTTSSGTGITYQWQSSPAGANTFTDISGQTTNSYTATNVATSTDYRCVLTCSGNSTNSNVATINITATVANDLVCNATPLVLDGPSDCGNTSCATATGDPTFSQSTANNTVWYTFTPTTTGVYNFEMTRPSGVTTGLLNGWLGIFTATGTCPGALTFTEVTPAMGAYNLPGNATVTLITPSLTAGTTYYFMVDGVSGAFGAYCIALKTPPPPPPCTTNITPVNAATGVTSVATGVPITWNAAAGATSYDVFFGTTNPPTANIGNIPATTVNITGIQYNTTYYWYVVPRNAGGVATGCSSSTTSFTTETAPNNCVPIYATGCTGDDKIDLFRLKGEAGGELNINTTGVACVTPAYIDSTDHPTIIDLARGKSYWGQARCGFGSNYISAWIDGNDNGQFENSERIINNLLVGTILTNINFFVPLSTPTGNHRLRIRNVYYGTVPTAPTDACGPYTFGETEDYRVNVVAGGTPYTVASYTPDGNCYTGIGSMTVDPASLSSQAFIPIVDSIGNFVAQIYPNNNDLGTITASYYDHNGPVRQDATGRYYLDRNFTITASKQPSTTYNLRLGYPNSILNTLVAQPGSGVTANTDLNVTKITSDICLNAFAQQTPVLVNPNGYLSIGGTGSGVDLTNLTSLSTFFLHGGSTTLLPVTLAEIRGEVTGTTNTVYWTTTSEQSNRKFVVERSLDGRSFTSIGEVSSSAINGNSSTPLSYNYVDANPVQGKQYYRLQMVDLGGRTTQSQIVTLRRGGGKIEIVDVRPNPTTGTVYFNVLGANANVNVAIRDLSGKEVIRKGLVQSNSFSVDMSKLTNGIYMLEVVDTKTAEKAIFKVVKQ